MNQINTPLKFKYNLLENKLWRIEEDYLYSISEDDHLINHFPYLGIKINFRIGENRWLLLTSENEKFTRITAHYYHFLNDGTTIHYEKKIKADSPEVIFEFTESDRKADGFG